MTKLTDPLQLPCGATLPNRLAKAATIEGLATPDGAPTPALTQLYGIWSDGGAGMLLSGNIQIDRDHLERPGNVILHGGKVESDEAMVALKQWAATATRNQNHFWAQLNHSGRQVLVDVNPNPKAPSAVKLGMSGGKFGQPVALTLTEITAITESFATAAKTCQECGFTGVEIHAAHGYLLSSFLNPRANQRTDKYGGSLENRARLLLEVVSKIRKAVGPKFPIAAKLNSADFQKGGFRFEDSLQVVQWLESASIDLIEISGGNYEQGNGRKAYFLDFAQAMQQVVNVPLMVTGGFRTKIAMEDALESGGADVIGLGRPLCVMTDAPKQLLQGIISTLPKYEDNLNLIPNWLSGLKRFQLFKVINSFASIYWFYEQLESLGQTGAPISNLGTFKALQAVEARNHKILSQRTKGITAPVNKKANHIGSPILTPGVTIAAAGVTIAVSIGFVMMRK